MANRQCLMAYLPMSLTNLDELAGSVEVTHTDLDSDRNSQRPDESRLLGSLNEAGYTLPFEGVADNFGLHRIGNRTNRDQFAGVQTRFLLCGIGRRPCGCR